MSNHDTTCWTEIHAAAEGNPSARENFARRYTPIMRAYFGHRWRRSPLIAELEDAVQEAFVECFRQGGVLASVNPQREFRPYFFGTLRKLALRAETKRGRRREVQGSPDLDLDRIDGDEESLSQVFDKSWAATLIHEARDRMTQRANTLDEAARLRVEILRLRFVEDMQTRHIAQQWNQSSEVIQREYRKAREEFLNCLIEVMSFYQSGTREELKRECQRLLEIIRGSE